MPLFAPPAYPDLLRCVFWDDFVAASYNNRAWAVTGTGSVATVSALGGVLRVRANAGASYRMNHGNIGGFSVAGKAMVVWRGYMTPATGASGLTHCGFQDVSNPTTNYLRWIYQPNVNANFRCSCMSGGTETLVDSGVAGDNNNHEFRIESITGSVKFYLDGVLKATITTNIPAGQLQPFVGGTGSATTVSDVNVDWVWVYGDRA